MKTILVTGVAGFIGARIADFLLGSGTNVVGVDNFSNYYDPRLKHHRVGQLTGQKGFTLINADITDLEAMNSVFANSTFSAVIHLAGMAGIRHSLAHPLEFERTNVYGTVVLLDLMHRYHVPTLVFASSSSVYAGNDPPFVEDMKTDSPTSIYAATKKSAEALIHSYHELYGINCIILRYFSVYGPQGRPDMSYFRFIREIDENRPIRIYGDGKQKREFTFIDDIARGTISALPLEGCHICNLGGGGAYSINNLVAMIEISLTKKAIRFFDKTDISDLPTTSADTSKARELLHWIPSVQFEDGMAATLKWHFENRDFIRSLRYD
jgi:Nucleoside-diphosphate-sugar epimerases